MLKLLIFFFSFTFFTNNSIAQYCFKSLHGVVIIPVNFSNRAVRFEMADYNEDLQQDLFVFVSGISEDFEEVYLHILDNKSKSVISKFKLPKVNYSDFDFKVGDYNKDGILDVYAIKRTNTASNTTEVHVLDGAKEYQEFLIQTPTGLHKTSRKGKNAYTFDVADYNNDGDLDICLVKAAYTPNDKVEVHILDGRSLEPTTPFRYQNFLLHQETLLPVEFASTYKFMFQFTHFNFNPNLSEEILEDEQLANSNDLNLFYWTNDNSNGMYNVGWCLGGDNDFNSWDDCITTQPIMDNEKTRFFLRKDTRNKNKSYLVRYDSAENKIYIRLIDFR